MHASSQVAAHPVWAAWCALILWHRALCWQSASSHMSILATQYSRLLHGVPATSPHCIVSIFLGVCPEPELCALSAWGQLQLAAPALRPVQ